MSDFRIHPARTSSQRGRLNRLIVVLSAAYAIFAVAAVGRAQVSTGAEGITTAPIPTRLDDEALPSFNPLRRPAHSTERRTQAVYPAGRAAPRDPTSVDRRATQRITAPSEARPARQAALPQRRPARRPETNRSVDLARPSYAPANAPQRTGAAVLSAAAAANPTVQPIAVDQSTSPSAPPTNEPAAPEAETPTEKLPSADQLQAKRKTIQENTELSDDVKSSIEKRYQSALDNLTRITATKKRVADLQHEIDTGAERIAKLRTILSAESTPSTDLPSNAPLAELETLLLETENSLAKHTKQLVEREADLKSRAERKSALVGQQEDLQQRITETKAQMEVIAKSDANPDQVEAERIELRTRVAWLKEQQSQVRLELKRIDALKEWFPMARDHAQRQVNDDQRMRDGLQKLVAATRKKESQQQAELARQAAKDASPALRELAQINSKLAERRTELSNEIAEVEGEISRLKSQLKRINDDRTRAEDRVRKAGHSTSVGLMLRRNADQLPDVVRSKQRLKRLDQVLPNANLSRMEFDEQRSKLIEVHSTVQRLLATVDFESSIARREDLEATARELLNARTQLLDAMLLDQDNYVFKLESVEDLHRELIVQTNDFQQFIDEHVLWIRSAGAFETSVPVNAVRGFQQMLRPSEWIRLLETSGIDALRRPLPALGLIVFIALLFSAQSRLDGRIDDLCGRKANTAGSRLTPTLKALGLTVLATAEWPLVIGALGWRMSQAAHGTNLGRALGPALQYVAVLLWIAAFIRSLCRPNGVAARFFGWYETSLTVARNCVGSLTFVSLPLAVLVIAASQYQNGDWNDSTGRTAFVALMLAILPFNHWLLGSKNHALREPMMRSNTKWLARVRLGVYWVGMILPLSLAVLALLGFYYSAIQLAIRFQATLLLVLGSLIIQAIAARWFLVMRRRMAIEDAKQRQQNEEESPDGYQAAVPVDDSPDWNSIHEQLRLLLRQAVTVGLLIGVWVIWSDVLPALRILDRAELWSYVVDVPAPEFDANDEVIPESLGSNPVQIVTTLRHGLIAAVILIATFFLGKNLPALLEMTILNHLPLDRGGRHAVSVLLHYGVVLAGLLGACKTLNIQWSSVQWLAAGITVGLGFGLQEIFANFVSGIILLFERPIRVGDIITLDDVTGTVTNIRIRATTVTNWDRKELIVPNRELITGRLLNWTLTDTTNRLVLQIGVAYGTDTERARQLMIETVTGHANVLEDPAPLIIFESFGDSTLNFVIRAYLASLDVRLQTVHELNTTLHHELTKNGIEIAFPQRDINIRNISLPAELATSLSTKSRAA